MSATLDPLVEREDPAREHPSRVVWALAWPAVALNSLQVVNTLLDRGFIGHLPQAALTAQGAATNVMFLMFSLAIAVATGATALVSRAFGAGDDQEVHHAAQESLGLALFGGVLVGLATAVIAPFAASALLPRTDVEAQRLMSAFLVAYAVGLPPIFVIQTLAGSLRGVGDTKSPMVISGVQIFLHMVLNYGLIFGAGLGLVGAASALTTSSWISAIAYVLYVGRTPLGRLSPIQPPDFAWVARILRIAIPAGFMSTLRVLSQTAFTLVLKEVAGASAAIAAMTVGFSIESIMFMPSFGLSAAASALVGQSLGMRNPRRAERLGWTAAHHGALVTIALVSPVFIFAPSIASLLVGGKPDITYEASLLLRYLCTTEFLFAYAMVLIGAMQGAGDTVRPLWISIISLWGLRVPLAIVLSLPTGFPLGGFFPLPFGLNLGSHGVWISIAFTQATQGVLALLAFRQGKWKMMKV